ncbi:MAG: NAD-dependent epimerase/dehydratase family protein [Gammaproteobacteria bacterium]|nr:NAD-dependent epimerase/dehydratase family protein [Gammaproteobacteria bacterium]
MDKGKIAVTGATGFLGSHLTTRLIDEGYQVNILARDEGKAKKLANQAVNIVIGDIADPEAAKRLCEGCQYVVHLVSNFRTASGPPESYRQINVDGTKNIYNAAADAGASRFVHCSTIGVHGSVKVSPATEETEFAPGDLYQETKLEAEQYVTGQAGKTAMELVVVRPTSMYGPGDMRMLKMFKMLKKRTFFKVGPCQENFHAVYIDDIVDGFIKAIETPGIDKEKLLIGGSDYLPLEDYIDVVARAVDAPPPRFRFPYPLFYYAAIVCEKIFTPFGIEPPLHVRRVRFFKNNRAFNIDKARRVLGYAPKVSLEEGMKRTAAWYKENGYL